jgi:hypothetical protein
MKSYVEGSLMKIPAQLLNETAFAGIMGNETTAIAMTIGTPVTPKRIYLTRLT